MPPRRSIRVSTARGAGRGVARGAARGTARGTRGRGAVRGAARGAARGVRVSDNAASAVGGDEPSVERQSSGVNVNVEPEVLVPVAGHDMELQSKLFDRFLKRNPPKFSGAETPI